MPAEPRIQTQRLELRPLRMADLETLHALWTNERVRKYLWDGERIPIERTREVIEASSRLFAERGFGIWAVHHHGNPDLLAFAGYHLFRAPPTLELVFGVALDHWGRGFATEAARAVIQYGFDAQGFDSIAASTDAPNTASARVLDKLGMRFRRRAVTDGLDTCFYVLTREDWVGADTPIGGA